MQTINEPTQKGMIRYAKVGNETVKLRVKGPSFTRPEVFVCEDFDTGAWFALPASKLFETKELVANSSNAATDS